MCAASHGSRLEQLTQAAGTEGARDGGSPAGTRGRGRPDPHCQGSSLREGAALPGTPETAGLGGHEGSFRDGTSIPPIKKGQQPPGWLQWGKMRWGRGREGGGGAWLGRSVPPARARGAQPVPGPGSGTGGCTRGGCSGARGTAPKAPSGSPGRSGQQIPLMSNGPGRSVTLRSPGREQSQPRGAGPGAATPRSARPRQPPSADLWRCQARLMPSPAGNGQCLSRGHQLPRV